MRSERITNALTDAYKLLDFSEKLLDDVENQSLAELPRILQLLRKNLRDAKALINDAEKEFDAMIREIDEDEERGVVL